MKLFKSIYWIISSFILAFIVTLGLDRFLESLNDSMFHNLIAVTVILWIFSNFVYFGYKSYTPSKKNAEVTKQ